MYAKSYDLPVCVTRCANFFGGGDLNWNRLVPGTIRSVVRGERPVIRSDGHFTRDYIYVDDGALAYVLLAERLAARPELRGDVFNFSYEHRMSVLEMVAKILEVMGSTAVPDVRNEASNEIRDQYLDAAKARTVLGWVPAFTLDCDHNIAEAVERLLRTLTDPLDRKLLAPLILDEILFRLLRTEAAAAVRAGVGPAGDAHRIVEAMRFIRENHADKLSVDELARKVAMSPSHFAHRFSAVARVSPMRYLREVRLDTARSRLVSNGARVSDA